MTLFKTDDVYHWQATDANVSIIVGNEPTNCPLTGDVSAVAPVSFATSTHRYHLPNNIGTSQIN